MPAETGDTGGAGVPQCLSWSWEMDLGALIASLTGRGDLAPVLARMHDVSIEVTSRKNAAARMPPTDAARSAGADPGRRADWAGR